MNHEDVTNRENESETIDTLEYQKDIQTLKISQLMFHDENIQRELAIIQDKNRENLLEQDITFYNGYIIGILALKHFKDIEAVVFLTNQDYLNVYYEQTKNLYVIYNEKVGCVALNRDDFLTSGSIMIRSDQCIQTSQNRSMDYLNLYSLMHAVPP